MAYPPSYHIETDPNFARRIMKDHAFALLVGEGMEATHLPLLLKEDGPLLPHEDAEPITGALYGHVARNNPLCAHLSGGAALAVFSGPHAYVSATLYDDPRSNVPTWNHASVQVRGRFSIMPDADVIAHLNELSLVYEGDGGWTVSQAPEYVDRLQRGIIAFRIDIESVRAIRKMSANKSPAIQKRIIDAARAGGEEAFADEMETGFDRLTEL